jgi:DNA-binding protein HU-beta
MSKLALVASIATKTNESQATVGRVLDALFSDTVARLRADGEVLLPSIGKLKATNKPERPGRNPRTGEAIVIDAKVALKFVPAKALKDAVN